MLAAAAYCDIELGTTIFDKLGVSKVADKIDSTFTSASAMAEVCTPHSCSAPLQLQLLWLYRLSPVQRSRRHACSPALV